MAKFNHIHDIIRDRLYAGKGLFDPVPHVTVTDIEKTEWDPVFEQLMRNRLIMGRLRYESLWKKKKGGYNYIKSVREKLTKYEQTGNTELLVDIANYMLIMFNFDGHPNHHFAATDDQHHCEKL